MALRVITRQDTGSITIDGVIEAHGERRRIRKRAAGSSLVAAKAEARQLEIDIIANGWPDRRAAHCFVDALEHYLKLEVRSAATKRQCERLLDHLGAEKPCAEIDDDTVIMLKDRMLRPDASEATVLREIITPLRAILRWPVKKGWCLDPDFNLPKIVEIRTLFLLPAEVDWLLLASASHLVPLLTALVGTGMRMSEALYLDWCDVDLIEARIIVWADRTKGGKRRTIFLTPRVLTVLTKLPHRDGRVFRRDDGEPYAEKEEGGGQIKTGWHAAIRRAGLNPDFTPHTCRHTWATWHYAQHKDLLRLKHDGGWSSVKLVERYAHLMTGGQEPAIRDWLGLSHEGATANVMRQVSA